MFKDAVILIINKIIEEKNIENKKKYIQFILEIIKVYFETNMKEI